jgi:hypothetical protein
MKKRLRAVMKTQSRLAEISRPKKPPREIRVQRVKNEGSSLPETHLT